MLDDRAVAAVVKSRRRQLFHPLRMSSSIELISCIHEHVTTTAINLNQKLRGPDSRHDIRLVESIPLMSELIMRP